MPDLRSFLWPSLPSGLTPVWTGTGFAAGSDRVSILEYHASESNWSDSLTALHELEAGSDHPIDVLSRRVAARTLSAHCPAAEPIVLDVGSSSGYLVEEFHRSMPSARLICSDFLAGPLKRLAQSHPDVPLLQFDLTRCPLPSESVDAVTALNVLEHIRDDQAALAQMHRVLRHGGLAYVEVPAHPGLYGPYDRFLMHHRRYRMKDLTAKARSAGFEVLTSTYLGFTIFPAYALVKLANRLNPAAGDRKLVEAQVRSTRKSGVMKLLMDWEFALGARVRFPTGIRCAVTLRRR